MRRWKVEEWEQTKPCGVPQSLQLQGKQENYRPNVSYFISNCMYNCCTIYSYRSLQPWLLQFSLNSLSVNQPVSSKSRTLLLLVLSLKLLSPVVSLPSYRSYTPLAQNHWTYRHLGLRRRRQFISVCNQPPRSTQPSTLCGTVKWVPAKRRWCSAAGE